MKTNLTILLMVFASLTGLAQKSSNSTGPSYDLGLSQYQYDPYKEFLKKKDMLTGLETTKTRQVAGKAGSARLNLLSRSGNLKAGMALPSMQLDSILDYLWDPQLQQWNKFNKEWYEYDSLARTVAESYFGTEGAPWPDFGGRWEATYDANGNLSKANTFFWHPDSGIFLPENETVFDYNANNMPISQYSVTWDYFNQVQYPSYTDTTSYDGNGNRVQHTIYGYDTLSMSWNPGYRYNYLYDSVNTLYRYESSWWNTDSLKWELLSYSDYYFDEMGRDSTRISYYWNGSWFEENSKKTYVYDAMGNIIQEASWTWDGESQWIGSVKFDRTFNASNQYLEEVSSYWDYFYYDWYISDKTTQSYDGNGNMVEETWFWYDTASKAYTPDRKTVYDFDLASDISDIAIPNSIKSEIMNNPSDPFVNKPTGFTDYVYDTIADLWDTTEQEVIHYSPFGSMAPVQCNANFGFSSDQDPLLIFFSDASGRDVVSWYWNFGDGTSSTLKNPKHYYEFPGTYKVSLSTIDASGECTNTMVKQIVVGNTLCNAEFQMTVDTVGMTVNLVNTSQGNSLNYFWNFGDGEGSKLMNPTHTYSYPGNYTISLTVQNALGTCMDRYSLSTQVGTGICKADFDVFVDSSSNTATFRTLSPNKNNLYRWEFGDGSFETTPNVIKTFTKQGYYTATLKVANTQAGCVNTQSTTILIGQKSPGGKAGFIYMSGNESKVRFRDRSLGDNLKYYWNFSGTDTSTMQNPIHDFVIPGYYSVCLTVVTPDGERNTHCEKIFAGEDTKDECLARFEYRLTENQRGISCLDRSLGNPDQWKWTYDDGWSTTQQNPSWSTGGPRYLKLQQTIRNTTTGCRDDAVAIINMGADAALKAGFGYVIDTNNTKADTYPIDFIGVSLGDAGKLKWSFGDGTFDSTTINPVHNYASPGTYEVCLTVTNTTTGEEDTSCEMVTVGSVSSTNDLSRSDIGLVSYPNPFSESTKIEIQLSEDTEIDLFVCDLMGRKLKTVAQEQRPAGSHIFELNASDMEAGNYYLILETMYGKSRSVLSLIR